MENVVCPPKYALCVQAVGWMVMWWLAPSPHSERVPTVVGFPATGMGSLRIPQFPPSAQKYVC